MLSKHGSIHGLVLVDPFLEEGHGLRIEREDAAGGARRFSPPPLIKTSGARN